jgi:hypothetical protein
VDTIEKGIYNLASRQEERKKIDGLLGIGESEEFFRCSSSPFLLN